MSRELPASNLGCCRGTYWFQRTSRLGVSDAATERQRGYERSRAGSKNAILSLSANAISYVSACVIAIYKPLWCEKSTCRSCRCVSVCWRQPRRCVRTVPRHECQERAPAKCG